MLAIHGVTKRRIWSAVLTLNATLKAAHVVVSALSCIYYDVPYLYKETSEESRSFANATLHSVT